MTINASNPQGWGRFPAAENQVLGQPLSLEDCAKSIADLVQSRPSLLPRGMGRSYGDSCTNSGGGLLQTRSLDHLLAFDPTTGIIRCEAGVSFAEIIDFALPRGFFLPVTPGTKFVTVGGAIANDVHGKNHHRAGNFGHHVTQFEILRSDGARSLCSPSSNPDLFFATIGGLGLTGLITWAEFKVRPARGPYIDDETVKFNTLDDFFSISAESEEPFEYTVAWIDCLASGKNLGRGLFYRGNHSERPAPASHPSNLPRSPSFKPLVPVDLPSIFLNPVTLQLANTLFYEKQRSRLSRKTVHYDPFFYPLDAVIHWNKLYGHRGFVQYQLVVPMLDGGAAIREILQRIAFARMGSFLAVLKMFGKMPSLGMMSFPCEGVTLALDFPMNGKPLLTLLDELDRIVIAAGGRVYLGKDARLSPAAFAAYYPQASQFSKFVDPKFSSGLWRRVNGTR